MKKHLILLLGGAYLSLFTPVAAGRFFKTSNGKTFEAELVAAGKTQAILKLNQDGRKYRIPLALLSESDQEYIREQRETEVNARRVLREARERERREQEEAIKREQAKEAARDLRALRAGKVKLLRYE